MLSLIIFLHKAELKKNEIVKSIIEKKTFYEFDIKKLLGFGWEGAVYLAYDQFHQKKVLKIFYDHRVEKLNKCNINFYKKR
jgi:hypothetical protein